MERKYMLEWDEGEPMLTEWYNGLIPYPVLTFEEAKGQLIRFWQDRIADATSALAAAEALTEDDIEKLEEQ